MIGRKKEIVAVENKLTIDVCLVDDPILLDVFVLKDYRVPIVHVCNQESSPGCSSYHCPSGSYLTINTIFDSKLDATLLDNGTTKMDYKIQTVCDVTYSGHHSAWDDAKYIVHYTISKSTDNAAYREIGTSISDNKSVVKPKGNSTLTIWGRSEFWDKELNEADSTYYLVEGHIQKENDDERELVYRQKIVVLPTKNLRINNLYIAPKSNQLEISLSSLMEDKADFIVSDMSGRVLCQYQYALFKENNNMVLTCGELVAGVYVLSVRQNRRLVSRKFVVLD